MSATEFYKLGKEEKIRIFTEIQKQIPLPLASIEKDWWVVQTLSLVFQMEAAPHLVFKGGTSLSKAWGIIKRLSEDVDLALSREFLGFSGEISRTRVGKLRDASYKYISEVFLPELTSAFRKNGFTNVSTELFEVQSSDQDPVKIAIKYPSVVEQSKYISSKVILEVGSRSMLEPFTNRQFCSYVGDNFAGRPFADANISIPSVNPERTFLEKLFLLHEEFKRPKEDVRVDQMSRHLFDIQKIATTEYATTAINDKELYKSIVEHREYFMRWGGVDYSTHFPPNLNPVPPNQLRAAWETDYKAMQMDMIFEDSLSFEKLIEEIKAIVAKINSLKF